MEPHGKGVSYARMQVEMVEGDDGRTMGDGVGGFFHRDCPPETVGYTRRELDPAC